jgi:hypothetical protein
MRGVCLIAAVGRRRRSFRLCVEGFADNVEPGASRARRRWRGTHSKRVRSTRRSRPQHAGGSVSRASMRGHFRALWMRPPGSTAAPKLPGNQTDSPRWADPFTNCEPVKRRTRFVPERLPRPLPAQKKSLQRGLKPTPGLEPGTPSVRVMGNSLLKSPPVISGASLRRILWTGGDSR